MSYARTKPLSASSSSISLGDPSNEIPLPADAKDTISSISWSPTANYLAAASWDSKVRIYDIGNGTNGAARNIVTLSADRPFLDCDWAKDGSMIAAAGADGRIHVLDAATGQTGIIGAHDAPIRSVRFVEIPGNLMPIMATGSWDKTIRYWDVRTANHVATLNCKERVYSMDAKAQTLVVGTADRHIQLVDLKNPSVFFKSRESALPYQTKAVAVSPTGEGWLTSDIGGRAAYTDINESNTESFTFRCHRDDPDAKKITKVWSVNAVQFHPIKRSNFVTAGSDGSFVFWDRVSHSRVRRYPAPPSTTTAAKGVKSNDTPIGITAGNFNRDGNYFAYAYGYDWSRGAVGNTPQTKTALMLHHVIPEDLKRKS
ncbi:WD40 repeat-like protein [Hypoxylon trugodes]|uniref:WD40 repeat-like protein n=1 Tax=Hypoxylon trugodes TaxID=326681 RepID=UPI00219EC9B9|nr:WD40 repeat-like protein [Hypoxylon trugodes]KAI1384724.1 WD40 repeat-like protein [Hypoxylon trugodes]